MSYDAYTVRLDPQDDNGYAHIQKFGVRQGIKLLSTSEGNELRELLLADNELGKTVGKNGIHGEGYIVLNTFPRMVQLERFFNRLASEEYDGSTFYSMNVKRKAEAKAAAAVSKAEGGFRRSSLRKSAKRAQRKNSRVNKLR
jgi:hypothetical protein